MRSVYLKRMDADAAWAALRERVRLPEPPATEEIAVEAAAGRVSARHVTAQQSSPSYHAAAMDGFAVRAADVVDASAVRPVRLALGEAAIPVDTGDPMPAGFDAVVKIEDVHDPEAGVLEVDAAVAPWQHVRLTGEDLVAGDLIVPQGKVLTAYDLAALLAGGVTRVLVRRRPRVALLPTGDELVEPGAPPAPGAVVEFNTRMLAALVEGWGGVATRLAPVRDERPAIESAVRGALETHDVACVIAGSSAGRDDHTAAVLRALGELVFHGINVMPGKPSAGGVTASGQAILGLPGYPVSCAVAADRLLAPLVALLLGVSPIERERVRARVARKIPSKVGHEEVLRVQVGQVGAGWCATPLSRGAGAISSLARANALLTIPALVEGLPAGAEVEVELLVPRAEAARTLIHIGSHDLALDLAGDVLRRRHPGRSLASANVGSLGGLHALARGECHFAGTHLLDPATGVYNVSEVRRVFGVRPVALVRLVEREQGFVVARGNPKGVRAFEDLVRPDVRIVNRQRGAGTRVLLDARLAERGLDPERVQGYAHEEYTHTAAAVAVASGVADAALAIRAAATALALDFVPLEMEHYELAVPLEDLEAPHIAALLDTIRSGEFRAVAEGLGGYAAARSGTVVAEVRG